MQVCVIYICVCAHEADVMQMWKKRMVLFVLSSLPVSWQKRSVTGVLFAANVPQCICFPLREMPSQQEKLLNVSRFIPGEMNRMITQMCVIFVISPCHWEWFLSAYYFVKYYAYSCPAYQWMTADLWRPYISLYFTLYSGRCTGKIKSVWQIRGCEGRGWNTEGKQLRMENRTEKGNLTGGINRNILIFNWFFKVLIDIKKHYWKIFILYGTVSIFKMQNNI